MKELSIDLEKGREAERMAQLGAMEAEVSMLQVACKRGDMGGIIREFKTLSDQLQEYLKGIEADEDRDVTLDPSDRWKKAALDVAGDILQQVSGYGRHVANKKEDALGVSDRASGGHPACPGKWKTYRKKKINSNASVM
jgi:hypothetical protein